MLLNFSFFKTIFNDAPQPWQLGFQDSANSQCYQVYLNYIVLYSGISLLSFILFFYILKLKNLEIFN